MGRPPWLALFAAWLGRENPGHLMPASLCRLFSTILEPMRCLRPPLRAIMSKTGALAVAFGRCPRQLKNKKLRNGPKFV
jgi:hypothetical protein